LQVFRGINVSSISNNEAVVVFGLAILVADETVAPFGSRLAFDVEQGPQVFEEAHLVAVVFGVVFNVSLVRAKIFDDVFLLSELKKSDVNSLTFALKNSW
jgi:hypothetical protein